MFNKTLLWICFVLAISVPLFVHLDKLPFRLWDESRLAANALEMHRNGNYLVTYYEGAPDMWNTKPPLMIWLQVMAINVFGFNELAVRLPAALAGLITCIFLAYATRKITENIIIGFIASLVLVTANGYIDTHAIRTGDYDGVLALFTTVFLFAAFFYSESGRSKWIRTFFAGLTLAVLTKSVQPLVFLPGVILFMVLRRRHVAPFIKRYRTIKKATAWAMLCTLTIAAYYIGREMMNKGYLAAIWNNELGGRYLASLEENTGGTGYYFEWIYQHMFTYWIWFVGPAFVAGFISNRKVVQRFTLYNTISCVTYLAFITASKTKLYWYAVPLLPLLSAQIALGCGELYYFVNRKITSKKLAFVVSLLLLTMAFAYPYYAIAKKVYRSAEYAWDDGVYPISYLLQQALHGKASVDGLTIVYNGYDQHLRLYAQALREKEQNVALKSISDIKPGNSVIVCEQQVKDSLSQKFNTTVLDEEKGYWILKVNN